MNSLVSFRQNDSTRCIKTIHSNCSTVNSIVDNNRKSLSSNWENSFSRIFHLILDANERKSKSESTNEQVELMKKSSLHWQIVLNRREKSNAIIRPMYERIIEIFYQTTQDKQLNSSFINEKRKILFIRNWFSWFC